MSDAWLEQTREAIQPHHKIGFELLETAFLDHLDEEVSYRLDGLRELGIRLEMDDFGAGHASVVALQSIKPDRVKIDRDLVLPLVQAPEQITILQALAHIARYVGAQIVVEGVETQAHLDAVKELDCDAVQGYALDRPMPASQFVDLFAPARKQA